jgi:hypothetical protein
METAELDSYASRILADLAPFLASTSEDTLALIVETLTVTVKINLGSWLTSEPTRLLTRAVLEAWRRNSEGKHHHSSKGLLLTPSPKTLSCFLLSLTS